MNQRMTGLPHSRTDNRSAAGEQEDGDHDRSERERDPRQNLEKGRHS
jgi:hypothetical protein